MKELINKYFKYILLAALIYMPIFGHLDTLPFRIWDEARRAMNAFEMLNNGNFLVTYFEGKPDMWGTKPPLLIWIQVLFMKLIGVNELAVRLPSAFAAFFTCITILIFSLRYIKQFWFGFIAILVLITAQGYISEHGTRTGDYDALLTLFTTLSGLLFFAFCETRKNKFLYFFFMFTALAVLTKSIAGLFFVPALVIYALWQRKFLLLFKNKHFYFGLFIFLVLVMGYYLLREAYNPGYIAAVQENELGGRYFKAIESHKQGFWFYYENFITSQWSSWYLLFPCGVVLGLLHRDDKIRRIAIFSSVMVLIFFMVISSSPTKLRWYDVPMYPFLSILIAVFVYYIFDLLRNVNWINKSLKYNATPFIFVFLISIAPYRKIIDKTYLPEEYAWDIDFYEIGYFLRHAIKGTQNVDGYYLLLKEYNTPVKVYLKILQDKGVDIILKDWKHLDDGDKVIAFEKEVKQYIDKHYAYEVIQKKEYVVTYKVLNRKPQ